MYAVTHIMPVRQNRLNVEMIPVPRFFCLFSISLLQIAVLWRRNNPFLLQFPCNFRIGHSSQVHFKNPFYDWRCFPINNQFPYHSIFFIAIGRTSIGILPVFPHGLVAGMDFCRNIPCIPLIDDVFQGHGQIRPLTVGIKIIIDSDIPHMEQRKYPLNVGAGINVIPAQTA